MIYKTSAAKTPTILCDTDFLIALLVENESNHKLAKDILNNNIETNFIYSNLTEYELLTVLSRKFDQNVAVQIYTLFKETFENRFDFDVAYEEEIINCYKNSKNKNQSFFDIACLITAEKLNYKIASFDKFYPKELLAT